MYKGLQLHEDTAKKADNLKRPRDFTVIATIRCKICIATKGSRIVTASWKKLCKCIVDGLQASVGGTALIINN